MMALVFLYFIALIFIYGGELNAAIARQREKANSAAAALAQANSLSPEGRGLG
jgi:uncharacterized BrkB/YihY/UPF0761 family membrane protein